MFLFTFLFYERIGIIKNVTCDKLECYLLADKTDYKFPRNNMGRLQVEGKCRNIYIKIRENRESNFLIYTISMPRGDVRQKLLIDIH